MGYFLSNISLLCIFITNEMQLIQCSLLLSALYMFRAVFPPIIKELTNTYLAMHCSMNVKSMFIACLIKDQIIFKQIYVFLFSTHM